MTDVPKPESNDDPASKPSEPAASEQAAYYDHAEQARVAIKLLTNNGFSAEQLFVMCTDEKRSEEFRSRLMPAGSTQLNTAPSVVGGAGAAIGATLLGGLGLASGGLAGVAGAAIGALGGAGVGMMLGAGTCSEEETRVLTERFKAPLDDGKIVVVVKINEGDVEGRTLLAESLLDQARAGVV